MNSAITATSVPVDKPRMLIDGKLVESEGGGWIESINPSNEEVIGVVPQGTARDVARAIEAAEKAQPEWAGLTAAERGHYLRTLAHALGEQHERILTTEVIDTGNTISKLRYDVDAAISQLNYFAGLGYELKGTTTPSTAQNLHITIREPFGVVGRIVAFNHPIMFAASKMGPPLIAGNTVIIKPSEHSPMSACILSEICAEIFPPGVVNILTGYGRDAGDAIARHPKVKRLAFIGSVPTGMAIQRSAAEVGVKCVTLELGGKNPMIVFPDVDTDKAVNAAINGMNFAWQGQSCGSTSRIFLHEAIYNECLEQLCTKISAMKIGDPLSVDSQMGPMNNKAQLEKTLHYIQVGTQDGGRLVTGGKRPQGDIFEKGYWVEPTVFANMSPDMRLASEEVFGPILSVFKWSDVNDVVRISNSVEYGLTASIWCNDITKALNTARRVGSGYIWINGEAGHYFPSPFGGFRNSGSGREECIEEMLSYTEEKTIHVMLQ